ncbi:MAG: isopentenyl-diphosphate delta-isomerase, isopentenyl-diphosphate delta-isomerase [Parcubacteria group bacterium]|nr:isopentenyl-diphosphate delta-isomerase, isopentenyl-diphosphate delta-isomerase [Parcubacteria group bacterium]
MRIPVVDRNDIQIATKERDNLEPGDFYRVSALWLTNSKREILLAQRALSKENSPGKWGPAVAGTVEEGETYDVNIVKEISEEIGIFVSIDQLRRGPKLFIHTTEKGFFDQWYFYTVDLSLEEFVIQEDEVAQIRWVSQDVLEKWYAEHPEEFLSNTSQWLPQLLSYSS